MGWCFWNISSIKRRLNIVDTISFITWILCSQSCNVLFLTPVTNMQTYMYIWWLTIFLLWIYWHLGRLVRFNSLSCESLVKYVYLYLIYILDVLYMIYGIQYILLHMMCLLLMNLVKDVHHLAAQVDYNQLSIMNYELIISNLLPPKLQRRGLVF